MEPEICTKMIRNLSEKLVAKFPATTLSYSMVKIARLDDAFSEIFELDVSPGKGQSLLQGDKRRQRKGEKNKLKKKTKSLKAQVTLLHFIFTCKKSLYSQSEWRTAISSVEV